MGVRGQLVETGFLHHVDPGTETEVRLGGKHPHRWAILLASEGFFQARKLHFLFFFICFLFLWGWMVMVAGGGDC